MAHFRLHDADGSPLFNQLPDRLEDWEIYSDDDFAGKVLLGLGTDIFTPRRQRQESLCSQCSQLDFWSVGFSLVSEIHELRAKADACAFCNVLLRNWTIHSGIKGARTVFERQGSALVLAENKRTPALTILRSPGKFTVMHLIKVIEKELTLIAEDCDLPLGRSQLGLPELPEPGSARFFSLLRLWLDDCDGGQMRHNECSGLSPTRLPTRLIDVGREGSYPLRLVETVEEDIGTVKYMALSHRWGDPAQHPIFDTRRHDDTGRGRTLARFKESIPYQELPATFRDAVITTRALGVRYLWIDSLCIIQGKDGDFNEEAKRMEDVFSGAYCVLAASRATGQSDGFLGARSPRNFVKFTRESKDSFYICEPIDDFEEHVLRGELNRRGWVLQERALARRTIYFTETQTYFECGSGIRCETLGSMRK